MTMLQYFEQDKGREEMDKKRPVCIRDLRHIDPRLHSHLIKHRHQDVFTLIFGILKDIQDKSDSTAILYYGTLRFRHGMALSVRWAAYGVFTHFPWSS
jgi:hypothetical protein